MPPIELIARAVIQKGNKYLLAKQRTEPNTFLPGGHLEPGEYAKKALRRELREELGLEVTIGDFVGVLEHKFTDKQGQDYEEINLIFETEIDEESPVSKEDHLEFIWSSTSEFKERTLLPSSLPELLKKYMVTGKPFHYSE
jgi:8-oxo-dGTP pyrophosphatase MutT (NUDIX family)